MNQANPMIARRGSTALLLAVSLLLGACAGSSPGPATGATSTLDDAASVPGPTPVLPSSPPPPPSPTPRPAATTTTAVAIASPAAGGAIAAPIDLSCKTAADCTIKDVGSCCGYQPRCLNTNSPTYAAQVKAKCAREGRVSTCGMPAITGCECVAGKCANITQGERNGLLQ